MAALSVLTALGLGVGAGCYAWSQGEQALERLRRSLPAVDPPGTYRPPLKTRILAADGTLLTEIYSENRELLTLDEVPAALIAATVASEDRRFFHHSGISLRGVARAALANYRRGRRAEGASTITMQLARDLYLSREKTWDRKIREALLAVEIEKLYAKEEILELYLNQINYGKGAYGLRTAARMYFGCEPRELSLAQCAALAAVPQRPSDYHLYADRTGAVRRRDRILDLMFEQRAITAPERDAAKAEPLAVEPFEPPDWTPSHAPYYTSWAIREVVDLLGEDAVYRGGLQVYTALDLDLQRVADEAVRAAVARARPRGATDGAGVLLDPFNGRILALAGGGDWGTSQFNRATQARRQPGSAFKVFVYTAALDRGYRPDDTILDRPFTWREENAEPWSPRNYDGVYRGEVSLQTALGLSINVAAARLAERVGIRAIIGYAQRMGIHSPLRGVRSLCLGTSEVTLLELTSAYGCFPAGGMAVAPSTLVRIDGPDGKPVFLRRPKRQPAISPGVAAEMVGMLRGAMQSGTGRPAAFGVPHGGKTGTTQNARDAWFIGFTPHYVCGVWLGNDNTRRGMSGVYGGTFCGPAWRSIVQAAIARDGGPGEFRSLDGWASFDDSDEALGERITITSRVIPAASEETVDPIDEAVRQILEDRAARGEDPGDLPAQRPARWYEPESTPPATSELPGSADLPADPAPVAGEAALPALPDEKERPEPRPAPPPE